MQIRNLYRPLLTLAVALTLTSCNGMFEGIYDEPIPDTTFREGFQAADENGVRVLYLDARNYDEWIFLRLSDGEIERKPIPTELTEVHDGRSGICYQLQHGNNYTRLEFIPTDKQPVPEEWDLAIHHFDVRTNRGSAAATELGDIRKAWSLDTSTLEFQKDVWSEHQAILDLKEMMGYKIGYQTGYYNPVITQWATMDFSTPPPVYASTGKVYILRLKDGSEAALKLRSYMSSVGTKGFLTIETIYPL